MRDDIFKEIREEWENYLETDKKIDETKFEIEKYDFTDLLNCYKKWREEETKKGILDSYQIASKLLKNYEILSLSECGINEFMEEKEYQYKGIFYSAMINKLFKDGEIHINSDKINFIGCCDEDKKIIVKGDCKNTLGYNMKGGEIIVKGDCGDWIGVGMKGGTIKIYGDNFNPKKQISESAKRGKIYHKDKLVWKDGELI